MSDVRQQPTTGTGSPYRSAGTTPPEPTAWVGWVFFGAMMLVLLGSFQVIAGLVALFDDGYYVVGPSGLVVNVDYTAWGWVHLIIGLVALGAGFGLFTGAMWARVLGIAIAVVSAIVNFGFVNAYPFWALMMITLDVLVVYAIAAHGSEVKTVR